MKLLHSIITNKYVLYLISFLSLLQLFTFIYRNQLDFIIVYMLIAYIVFTFTRNMILILGIPLFILRLSSVFTIEGFEEEEEETKENGKDKQKPKNDKKPKSTTKVAATPPSSSVTSIHNEPILPEDPSSSSSIENENDAFGDMDQLHSSNLESIDNLNPADFETVSSETPTNSNSNKKSKDSKKSKTPKNKINYASNYMSNLKKYNNLLGNDGIYKMTEHTKELMQQQNQLGESIAKIVPLIQQMTPFLKTAGNLFNGNKNMAN